MFCTNCGKQIVDTARFCNYCGAKIVNSAENAQNFTQNIPNNPVTPPTGSVLNTGKPENVENSVDLLKVTEQVPTSIPQMNETPKSGFAAPQTGFGEAIAPAAPVTPSAQPEMSAQPEPRAQPEPSAVSSQPNTAFAAENLGQPAPDVLPTETPVSGAVPQSEQSAQVAPNAPTAPVAPAAQDAPNAPTAPAAQSAPNAPTAPVAPDAPEAAKKHTAEHKYTLGHLIMCLASTAIMAIVAGVFAGLYFSVV